MFRSSLVVGLLALASLGAKADPVTITTPFINFENRAVNSLGFVTGQYLRVGANSVTTLNNTPGTTGIATLSGTGFQTNIGFSPGPLVPNFFNTYLSVTPAQVAGTNIYNPWLLTFTNGPDSAQAIVQMQAGAQMAPFVNSITLSGSSAAPTFTWTPPPGTTVNGYRINIFDKSLINLDPNKGAINSGIVVSTNLQPNDTSYTVKLEDYSLLGYQFDLDKNYSIEISLIQTRDNSSLNLGNDNVESIARVYADFTPNDGGGPPVNLPVVLVNGSYQFNMSVVAGQTYYIDPEVAIGYDYAIGDGDPNFQSVVLPLGIGDDLYDLFGFDLMDNPVLLAKDLLGGVTFDFEPGGVSRFRVTGIETSAGLDPANTTAFVTGVSFVSDGNFTGTQTPIVQFVNGVPEPGSLALISLALISLAGIARLRSSPRQSQSPSSFSCASCSLRW